MIKKFVVGCAFVTCSLLAVNASAKTLVFCSEGSPEGFNAAMFTSGTTFDASSRIMLNRLVEFERGSTNIVPALAESWSVTDDGLEYTFKLRQGVLFQSNDAFTPSRDFNADDVIYSFDRQRNEDHKDHKLTGGSYEYFSSMDMGNLIKDITKVDDHTVVFHLTEPNAPFIANVAMDFASILSAEYSDAMHAAGTPTEIDTNPVGTGAYKLQAYQKDAVIRYQRHEGYWGAEQAIDNVVFAITPDASVRYAKVQAGECHVMLNPNPADLEQMGKDDKINLMQREGLNVGYLAMNTSKAPYDDVRVRRAINHAINRDAIIEAVYQGAGVKAKNPIPPTIWSYNNEVEDYAFDPEKAKALLAEAGLADGFETNIWAMPVQRPYNPNARRMAEMMQADLANIGIKAEIVSYEWGEYLKRSKEGEHDMLLLGWTGDNGDPDNFMGVLLSCGAVGSGNRAYWCDKEFDDLITKARSSTSKDERTELYKQAQLRFKDQAPWVTIAHSVVYQPVRKEVKDFRIDPFGGNILIDLDIDQ